MFPFGLNPKAIDVDEEPVSDDPNQKKPFACIKKRDGQTYCGREVAESKEYVFSDAAHALQHYNNDSAPIHVCLKCAARALAAGVGPTQYQPPMALRDLKENNR